MTDTFDALRPHILDYLYDRKIDPARRFRCLNPEHCDRNPSMGYDPNRMKVHCFACGADYDLFDLLTIDEHLTSPGEALKLAQAKYGAPLPLKTQPTAAKTAIPPKSTGCALFRPSAEYIANCYQNRNETDYFAQRGLSPATMERFQLGYDAKADCAVLPCEGGHVVRRSVTEKKYLNEKGQPSPLFQPELLESGEPCFLLEGTFDALSAEELGYRAAALNGAGNREKLAQRLRDLKKPAPVFVITDNDAAGEGWAAALCAEFPWVWRCDAVPEGKDLNEFLTADRTKCAGWLKTQFDAGMAHRPPPYSSTSAAGRMDALAAHIAEMAVRPELSTGFPAVDKALDGGLFDGLYVLGAVSSLGKTSFCMQMADQLAQQGRDVLIFTLEMDAFELMARSISRESFLADTSARRQMAKTVRGVLDGRRYVRYTIAERAHLDDAKQTYAGYAGHLYFREGDHETGLDTIQREIERHIAETGVRPVVLIDYLQIIAPVDVHFTDKQNLDRIVCSLKKLSRQYKLTIFTISSFNRENYNLEVSMAAFKESGGIDYSADVLLGLQARNAGSRSFNIDEEKRKDPRELELKILKNRSAALGEPVPLRYYPAFSCFEEG
ncbi:MAG: toprim domain-containing protein [Oscillibacter sp.]|jgi:replicative DNA helicase|nr:toprim domain-containing protein [Oscillibacter sp.]